MRDHAWQISRFFKVVRKAPSEVTADNIRNYLMRFKDASKSAYGNALSALKVFFRDFMRMEWLVESFRFPTRPSAIRIIPSKEDLQRFYASLETLKEKTLFLIYATTGLRRSEVLSLKITDVDFERRMIIPKKDSSKTKHAWISFFNGEAEEVVREYLATRKDSNPKLFPLGKEGLNRLWRRAIEKTGIYITPQVLREWFACEMARLKVPDRYVDAFCGRFQGQS